MNRDDENLLLSVISVIQKLSFPIIEQINNNRPIIIKCLLNLIEAKHYIEYIICNSDKKISESMSIVNTGMAVFHVKGERKLENLPFGSSRNEWIRLGKIHQKWMIRNHTETEIQCEIKYLEQFIECLGPLEAKIEELGIFDSFIFGENSNSRELNAEYLGEPFLKLFLVLCTIIKFTENIILYKMDLAQQQFSMIQSELARFESNIDKDSDFIIKLKNLIQKNSDYQFKRNNGEFNQYR